MFVFEVDYSHLNAVRARIVELERLAQFRWSSYRAFGRGADERPAWLSCEDWLRTHGELADTPAGWLSYQHRLAWLLADTGRQKEAAFETMSQGWALGSKDDQREVLAEFHTMEQAKAWGGAEVVEINRILWPERLEAGAKAIGASLLSAAAEPKSAAWKIALAAWLKRGSSVFNRWIAEQLNRGAPNAVGRYVGDVNRADRAAAVEKLHELSTKVRG